MSGLVDMWTAEMAKLREKGQALWSNGTGSSNGESIEAVVALEKGGNGNSTRPGSIFGRFSRVNSAVALCSEASVSMIVECVSP